MTLAPLEIDMNSLATESIFLLIESWVTYVEKSFFLKELQLAELVLIQFQE